MTLNRLPHIALLPLLAVALLTGCDSNDDETPDSERIVGTWTATRANIDVDSGTPLGTISVPVLRTSDEGEVTMSFDAGGDFTFSVTGPINAEFFTEEVVIVEEGFSETATGSYILQGDQQIRFGVDGTFDSAFNVAYDFDGDDEFDLSVENTEEGRAVLAFLLEGQVPQEVIDALAGGSITFERAAQAASLEAN